MKKVIILIIVCCTLFGLNAQNADENKLKNKSFYVEFGGPGVLFSANLDGRFNSESKLGLGYRVGLGFGAEFEKEYSDENFFPDLSVSSYGTIPLGINYLFGKEHSPHLFEIGAGTTILFHSGERIRVYSDNRGTGHFIGHATFMYRRQPLNGGFTFRVGLMPVVGNLGDFYLSAAVGLGYAF